MQRRLCLIFLPIGIAAALLGADAPKPAALPAPAVGPIHFARDIQPLFQTRCVECHGANKQKAGLRLDAGEAALRGGDSGPAIVPGKSGESKLIHLVAGLDPKTKMPPRGAS